MLHEYPENELHVFALGAPAIRRGATDLRMQLGSTTQLFFFYLLTTNTSHQREPLAELFWPERSAKQAASNLRTVLTQLRRHCGDQLLITREAITVGHTGIYYDVADFRRHVEQAEGVLQNQEAAMAIAHWEAAAKLYQRPFLAGIREIQSSDLQLWLSLERELLHNQFLTVLRQLADHYTQQGNYEALLPLAQRWLALEPFEVSALQAVMQALAQTGHPETALTHYRAYVRAYQQEHRDLPLPAELAAFADKLVKGGRTNTSTATRRPMAAVPPLAAAQPTLPDGPSAPTTPQVNRPLGATGLIGRASEIATVRTLLVEQKERLVTILGLGGLGKTSLALAVADRCRADFADGVWFVALETIKAPCTSIEPTGHDPVLCEQIATAIGNSLGLTFAGAHALTEQVSNQLRDRQLCLILDNFESLTAASPLLTQWLDRIPGLALLVTSRVRLNLVGEFVYTLGGLALPTAATVAAVTTSAAGQLFLEHGQRRLSRFVLDEQTAVAIAQLCRLTAGLPLALILASTWIEHLSPTEIVHELQSNLALLAADSRNLPQRQQSVQQIIEVSWQTLPPAEQLVLAQLSVFVEPFNRQAAHAVAGGTWPQLRVLTDKALLTVESQGIYTFHPLIHHFARQKLVELSSPTTPGASQAHARHAVYIRERVLTLATELKSNLLKQEKERGWQGYGDVQAALTWQLAQQPTNAVAFLIELCPLWEHYGYIGEARHWLQKGLAHAPEGSISRAHLMRLAGSLAEKQHDVTTARSLLTEALQIYQRAGETEGEAATLAVLGWVTFHERTHYADVQPAIDYIARSLQLYRALGNQRQIAHQLRDISQLLIMQSQSPPAALQAYLQEALALYQALADQAGQALILKLLSHLALAQEQHATAATYADQAIHYAEKTAMAHDLAWIYHIRCSIAYAQEDWTGLQGYSAKAYELFTAVQDPHGRMLTLFYMGRTEHQLGNGAAALTALRTSLQLAQQQELLYWSARNLAAIAIVAFTFHWPAAARLAGAVATLFTEQAARFTPWEQEELATLLADARGYCKDRLADEWEQGRAIPLGRAFELAYTMT